MGNKKQNKKYKNLLIMKKKHTLMIYLAAAFCGFTALLANGCTADDDFGRLPQGSIPLRVGDVTVAGMKPGTRGTGGNASTRAPISEDTASGYTGIRKSHFVNGDVLNLCWTVIMTLG